MEYLVVSPHCDDALLALGGTILQTKNVRVVTVFATCAWTAHPDRYDVASLSRLNKAEDMAALQKAKCKFDLYDYPEAFLRGYRKWNTKVPHASDKKLSIEVEAAVRKHAASAHTVAFPLAAGEHVDHMMICNIGLNMTLELLKMGKKVIFYEDLPYCWYGGREERIAVIGKKHQLEPELIDIQMQLEAKKTLLREYKTQLIEKDIERISDYANGVTSVGYKERVWNVVSA
jgi:LmbE family N-acetylglucosaminyl deacetylase